MQCPALGSGTQTAGRPWRIGMPSAPGYVPKYESNDRFSCMITTTCWILWIPIRGKPLGGAGGAVDPVSWCGPPPPQAAATNAAARLPRTAIRLLTSGGRYSSKGVKSCFRAPHTGQNHVSGMSSNAVPGGIPPSGSPSAGS